MADIKTMTNIRGPAARITDATAQSVPAGSGAAVRMFGPDQNRQFEFDVPAGLPGPNAVGNDEAFAAAVASDVAQTHGAVNAVIDQRTALPTSLTTTPYRTPRKPRPAGFQETFQAGHAWTQSGTSATLVPNDMTRHWEGLQAASIITAATGTAVTRMQKGSLALPDMSDKVLRVVMKIDRPDLVNQVNISIGGAGLADTFYWRPTIAFKPNEPTEITLPWSAFTGTTGSYSRNPDGTPSTRTGFSSLRVEVIPNSTHTTPITWTVQRIEPIPDWSILFPNGVVSIVDDDGRTDLYDRMRPVLRARNLRATHYVIAESIGTGEPFMSLLQLKQLHSEGDEIGLHAYSAAIHSGSTANGFGDATEHELRTDLAKGRGWLLGNGFSADSLAYPKGAYRYTTDGVPITEIVAGYFQTARTTGGLTAETTPPADLRRVNAITGVGEMGPAVGTPTALTATGGMIDRAKLNKDWVILVFHQIITGTPTVSEQCTLTGFTAIADKLVSSGVEVLPVNEVMARVVNAMP